MNSSNIQITVRGLDAATKSALVKKAAQHDMSLNRYALESLKQAAGTNSSEERYKAMKKFLAKNHLTEADAKAMAEALKWSDEASLAKQKRDERDLGL